MGGEFADWSSVRGIFVASALASASTCGGEEAPVFGADTSSTTTVDDSTTSTSVSSSDATSSDTAIDPWVCIDDADCGELRCLDGACYGCHTRLECPEQQGCWKSYCYPLDELPLCLQLDSPICGDDRIDAIEECDGAAVCGDCADGNEPEPWIAAAQIEGFVPIAPADVIALHRDGAVSTLVRHAADGSPTWSVELQHGAAALAIGGGDDVFVAGNNEIVGAQANAPWIASFDASGELRWSIESSVVGAHYVVAADATRVVAGGAVEQSNSPWRRGAVAQFDVDGSPQWSEKQGALVYVASVALIADETAVLGLGLDYGSITLLRMAADGTTLWSQDVSPTKAGEDGPHTVIHDGSGGTWSWGERDGGPWGVRHDGDGTEIERLDCVGNTAGRVTHVAMDPRGRLAIGVLVDQGPVPLERHTPWVAVVDAGAVSWASLVGPTDATLRLFGLAWLPAGELAVGVSETDPTTTRIVLPRPP